MSGFLEPDGDSTCEICLELLDREAYQCRNEHFFCQSCIQTVKQGDKVCSSCNLILFRSQVVVKTKILPTTSQQSQQSLKQSDNIQPTSTSTTLASELPWFSHVTLHNGVYSGQLDGFRRTGRGDMCYHSGETYSGDWMADMRHGQGCATYTHGEKFTGSWLYDTRQGRGASTYCNGDSFSGSWTSGMRHGKGSYSYACGVTTDGVWAEDQQTQSDKVTCRDGSVYKGEMRGMLRHGSGEMKYANGDVYTGGWVDDLRHGMGSQWYAAGKSTVSGMWLNDAQPVITPKVSAPRKPPPPTTPPPTRPVAPIKTSSIQVRRTIPDIHPRRKSVAVCSDDESKKPTKRQRCTEMAGRAEEK